MAMYITGSKLIINIPNSEAIIRAQHIGIKNRTVGSYYMSEKHDEIQNFLDLSNSVFIMDVRRTYENMKQLITYIVDNGYSGTFKSKMTFQVNSLDALKWAISQGTEFILVDPPLITESKKYLKLPHSNEFVKCMLDLSLGDLTAIILYKITNSLYVIYCEVCDNFQDKLSSLV